MVESHKKLKHLRITSHEAGKVLNLGTMEIWDGAQLALLREVGTWLVEKEQCRSLGIDMSHVKSLPSGFFGLLCNWNEHGACIRIFSPLPQVKQMLWFTTFFYNKGDGCYEFRPEFEDETVTQLSESLPPCQTVAVSDFCSPTERLSNAQTALKS